MYTKLISLASLATTAALANAQASTTTTAVATVTAMPHELLKRQSAQTTSYYSVYATSIPNDEYFMGMGRGFLRGGDTSDFWIGCTQHPYTVSSGYAGCGSDDLYTACVGNVAKAKDGTDITCRTSLGFECKTAEIYDDLDATDYTSWIICDKTDDEWALVRATTGVSTTLSGLDVVTETTSAESESSSVDSTGPTTAFEITGASSRSSAGVTTATSTGMSPRLMVSDLVRWVPILAVFFAIRNLGVA